VVLALLTASGPAASAADEPLQSPAQGQYSALAEINPDNVARLEPVSTVPIPQGGGYSGRLAAGDGRLYLETPFPHSILAFDVARPGAPLWSSTPQSDARVLGLDCCSATIGGPVLDGDRLYANTFDGHTLALDAATGAVLWNVRPADPSKGETLTLPPLAIGDRLIVGSSGDDYGARGWIAALAAADGSTLWKHRHTGPDSEVGIGADFKPAAAEKTGTDLGIASWPPDAWQHGGGGLAGQPIYDPELELLIYGTGHPAPWNPDMRSGEDKWTSGIFARNPKDGSARWFTPINPHDPYALGAAGSVIAADLPWDGRQRRVVIHPDANGMVYVLDRSNGAILAADAFVATNATDGVDPASGTLRRNDAKAIHTNTGTRDICPGWPGATGANGLAVGDAAFAPPLGLLFIPVNGLCMDMEARDVTFISGTAYMGANLRAKAAPGRPRGSVIAWDVVRRSVAWQRDESFPVQGSVLATAGGIVLYGTLDGWFRALDARTGRVLWQQRTDSGIIGRPLSFDTADGHQRIAVMAGIGGPIGRVAQNGIDLRDATAAHGFANALRDLPPPRSHGGTLYVFGLP
jgi:alcohol dehydrogenase (cytochrome c)